jgi:hypothetical protein
VFDLVSENSELSENICIEDSGASCHYYKSDQGLFDVRDVSERITVGSGKTMKATKIGRLRCNVEQVNEKIFQVLLQEVNTSIKGEIFGNFKLWASIIDDCRFFVRVTSLTRRAL